MHESLAEAFAGKLAERVAALVPGNGMDAKSTIGPLIESMAVQKVYEHVEDARSKGARVVTGGEVLRENGMARGNFYAPTVLLGVRPEMPPK